MHSSVFRTAALQCRQSRLVEYGQRHRSCLQEVVIGKTGAKTDNKFVGGDNKWKFDSFVNWEFWWPNFPVLVYFKETQTKPEGQIHFFPIIFDNEVLYETMKARCGKSKTSA